MIMFIFNPCRVKADRQNGHERVDRWRDFPEFFARQEVERSRCASAAGRDCSSKTLTSF